MYEEIWDTNKGSFLKSWMLSTLYEHILWIFLQMLIFALEIKRKASWVVMVTAPQI